MQKNFIFYIKLSIYQHVGQKIWISYGVWTEGQSMEFFSIFFRTVFQQKKKRKENLYAVISPNFKSVHRLTFPSKMSN